jgi:hypothetical protein
MSAAGMPLQEGPMSFICSPRAGAPGRPAYSHRSEASGGAARVSLSIAAALAAAIVSVRRNRSMGLGVFSAIAHELQAHVHSSRDPPRLVAKSRSRHYARRLLRGRLVQPCRQQSSTHRRRIISTVVSDCSKLDMGGDFWNKILDEGSN